MVSEKFEIPCEPETPSYMMSIQLDDGLWRYIEFIDLNDEGTFTIITNPDPILAAPLSKDVMTYLFSDLQKIFRDRKFCVQLEEYHNKVSEDPCFEAFVQRLAALSDVNPDAGFLKRLPPADLAAFKAYADEMDVDLATCEDGDIYLTMLYWLDDTDQLARLVPEV